MNGKFTLGENIGDLSGLTISYAAYRASLAGREAPVIDGLTGDQRFFMGFAQVWRCKYRDDDLKNRLTGRSALARGIPRQRHAAERGRILLRIRRERGGQDVPATQAAREDLVTADTQCWAD